MRIPPDDAVGAPALGTVAAGPAGAVARARAGAAANTPARLPPQAGDRFVIVTGTLKDRLSRAVLLEVGAAQVDFSPLDPVSGILRKSNRLNRVLAVRLAADSPTARRGGEEDYWTLGCPKTSLVLMPFANCEIRRSSRFAIA